MAYQHPAREVFLEATSSSDSPTEIEMAEVNPMGLKRESVPADAAALRLFGVDTAALGPPVPQKEEVEQQIQQLRDGANFGGMKPFAAAFVAFQLVECLALIGLGFMTPIPVCHGGYIVFTIAMAPLLTDATYGDNDETYRKLRLVKRWNEVYGECDDCA
jgi:hypothetical protein